MIVFYLGKDLLFKSVLGHCVSFSSKIHNFFLVSHVKTHNSYTCSECQEECASSQALKIHLWNLHKVGKGSEKCLCSLCGKTIVGRSNFKKHEREKHGIISATFAKRRKEVKIECSKCFANFDTAKNLDFHSVQCSGESKG